MGEFAFTAYFKGSAANVVLRLDAISKEMVEVEDKYYSRLRKLVDARKSILQKVFAGELR